MLHSHVAEIPIARINNNRQWYRVTLLKKNVRKEYDRLSNENVQALVRGNVIKKRDLRRGSEDVGGKKKNERN